MKYHEYVDPMKDRTSKDDDEEERYKADFYTRWYAKFGKPQARTMPADEFMKRLKEMRDFE